MPEEKPDIETLIDNIRRQFLPGGSLAPIQDPVEYERQMNALPPGERELAQEVTVYAGVCRYFSEKNWEVPPQFRKAVRDARTLEVPERIAEMREINQGLMEYLNDISEDTQFRM
jgi:hypothetical protein